MSELWTVRHVAQHLRVSPKRVYQLVQGGRLESLRLGPRQMRITRASVEQYVDALIAHERRELGLDLEIGPGARRRG